MKRTKLFEEVSALRGVGPKRLEAFQKLGIYRIIDLVTHLPRRYEDRRVLTPIANLGFKQSAIIQGKLVEIASRQVRPRLTHHKAVIADATGSIVVNFFNQDYILARTQPGSQWTVFGTCDRFGRERVILMKEIDLTGSGKSLGLGTILPYYSATAATPQRYLRALIADIVRSLAADSAAPVYHETPTFEEGARFVHLPETREETEIGRRRLALDELVMVRLCVEKALKASLPLERPPDSALKVSPALPFDLTLEQKRVLADIVADMNAPRRMRRLVEGDVGSGKTVLAILAAARAAARGQKTVFLAPTEILAEQHYGSWREKMVNAGLSTWLLTGATAKKSRAEIYSAAAAAGPALFFGTHALLSEKIRFDSLGLVVIDEQQRFGVVQRDMILKKGGADSAPPDMLTLTATPIPRTLAMTLYGDLEISTLRGRLPGRSPVTTIHLPDAERKKMMPLIRSALARVERVYIVYPLIEEEEGESPEPESDGMMPLTLRDAKGQHKKIEAAFPKIKVALLTGASKPSQKESTMRDFRDGAVSILVATSVVEVGLDVPEATLMIVEHAERFGLAQLHQLRGRVGRGSRPGTCVLTTADELGEYARQRIDVLLACQDGFMIAEEDLRLRGPGEILGERQHGSSELRAARLESDADLIPTAQKLAKEIADADPELARHEFFRGYLETREQSGAGVQ